MEKGKGAAKQIKSNKNTTNKFIRKITSAFFSPELLTLQLTTLKLSI